MDLECMFIKVAGIRRLFGIFGSKIYQIIRELNAELKSQGYMVLLSNPVKSIK